MAKFDLFRKFARARDEAEAPQSSPPDEKAVTPPAPLLAATADGETVADLFESILGRRIYDEKSKAEVDGIGSIKYWVERLISSDEFRFRFAQINGFTAPANEYINDIEWRTPPISAIEWPKNVLLVGSCMQQDWKEIIERAHPGTHVDYRIFNNASELEDVDAEVLARTDFQITQIPLRSLVYEAEYYSLRLDADGKGQAARVFDQAVARLRRNLDAALKYNRASGLTTFVLNFATPQANPLGRLAAKYDLHNFAYFVAELNRALDQMVAAEKNVYIVDFDEIAASLGKRHILDDATVHLNHGSFLRPTNTPDDLDLTPYGAIDALFAPRLTIATLATFRECVASHAILAPNAKIKLVVFDLDGTLWRGVAAEQEEIGDHLNEGWPLGVLEAAAYLRKRGVLLALASKNDPEIATRIWNGVYGAVFPLANFVSTKFSWGSKADSLAEILKETNLLPGNVLFVDDNPVERERVQQAFPGLRVLEGPVSTWRRTLLWAAELQTPYITEEAVRREDSIRSMIAREAARETLDEGEYLASLDVRVEIEEVTATDAPSFRRALELLNKTNQFNTTGRRWSEAEIAAFFGAGGQMLAARVRDRMSDYGLTALLLRQGARCEQMVMSCRVFGLGVEAALFDALRERAPGALEIACRMTEKNGPARSFLRKLGLATPEGGADAPVWLTWRP